MTVIKYLLISLFLLAFSHGYSNEDNYKVKITREMPFINISHQGINIKVKRVQDTKNRLVDDFSKTSRPCPPFCIHPMSASPGVDTIGELELLDFVNNEVKEGKGLLIDARMPNFFNSETIPGSINIPFILFTSDDAEKIITLLGVKKESGSFNFSKAKELCLFCNGPWCDQSPRAIKALVKAGYPASKLKYYRGGMQLWKNFSLTTIQPRSNIVKNTNSNGEKQ